MNVDYNGIGLKQKNRRKVLGSFFDDEKASANKRSKTEHPIYNKYVTCPSEYRCNAISSSKTEGACCPLQTDDGSESSNNPQTTEVLSMEANEYPQIEQQQQQQHQQTSE